MVGVAHTFVVLLGYGMVVAGCGTVHRCGWFWVIVGSVWLFLASCGIVVAGFGSLWDRCESLYVIPYI